MKYCGEYYLAKCTEKHLGEIYIGDLCRWNAVTHDTRIIIGNFNQKSATAKVYSSPIFLFIQYWLL